MAQVMTGSSLVNSGQIFGSDAKKRSRTSNLTDLVESSKNLPKRLEDIDTLHLSLNEIQKRAYNLRKYNKKDSESNLYTKAHYLLIGKGLTIEEIESDLNSITKLIKLNNDKSINKNSRLNSKSNTYSNLKPSNLESYMYRQKDEDVLLTIENSLTTAAKDFDSFVNKNINLDWDSKKNELREKLSNVIKRESSNSLISTLDSKKLKKLTQKEIIENKLTWGSNKPQSIISSNFNFSDVKSSKNLDSIINPNISYALRKKFELSAEVIYELNESRQSNNWYKLATVISSLYKSDMSGSSNKNDQIHESCIIIRDFCEDLNEDIDDELRPYRFSKATYSKLSDFESIQLRGKIVLSSRKYLENQFKDYINELYSMNNNTNANTNINSQDKFLIPNIDKVINFIELTLKTKQKQWKVPNMTFVNGLPLWAILFYLLRAGCYNEAIILVSKYEDSFSKLEKSFPFYLKSYCESKEKKLSDELQGKLNNEFNQYFKNSISNIDPFRYACYKLIGKCDLSKKSLPSITLSIEDWLWLHLSLIKEDDLEKEDNVEMNSSFNDKYRLVDLQKNILEFGPESFNISNKNPMYLQTLLLVGLYEDAIKYLYFNNEIDSIHLAVLLNYYGLIRINDNEEDKVLLNVDSQGFKSINFSRMIGNYVKKFKFSDPRVASEYLFLICMNPQLPNNDKMIKICQESIRDLVLETKEFVLLLGKIDKNGNRISGIIGERKDLISLKDEKSFLYNITEKAAQKANEDGRLYDCILLYQLSEEYDIVLKIVNKLLGDFINSISLVNGNSMIENVNDKNDDDNELNIIKLSENILKIYKSSDKIMSKISNNNILNCEKLLSIFKIFKEFKKCEEEEEDYDEGDMGNYFKILTSIRDTKLIPFLIDNDMNKIRTFIKAFNNLDESLMKNIPNLTVIEMIILQKLLLLGKNNLNSEKANEFRQVSKNLMIFAGLIKYKMSREIYSLLINLEINI